MYASGERFGAFGLCAASRDTCPLVAVLRNLFGRVANEDPVVSMRSTDLFSGTNGSVDCDRDGPRRTPCSILVAVYPAGSPVPSQPTICRWRR